jgi:cobalt-zinc-cadmium efflux system outer membrane protein
LLACSVPKEAGFPDVQSRVRDRTGERIAWHRGERAEKDLRDEVERLLQKPLVLPVAVRVALLNNRELQATFEELGVAQAELVQAGMLENPSLFLDTRIPTVGASSVKVEADLGFDLISIFSVVARKRIAAAELEATKLRVASEVIELIGEVKKAFYRLQAAQQLAAVDRVIAEAAQGSFDSARSLHQAGNISDLQLAEQQDMYERARLALLDSQGEVAAARERINRALGLWGTQASAWKVDEELPAVPSEEIGVQKLETLAIRQRFDLAAAYKRTLTLAHQYGLAKNWGWLQGGELGASLERETAGEILVGPHLELKLPIFDQGQAKAARALAEVRKSQSKTTALAVRIRSEVREHREELILHRRKAEHYRKTVIPLRERIVELTMQEYNFMLVGVFELLKKKQEEQEAYHDYIDAVRDYWLARVELEGAVGGRLPAASPGAHAPPPKPPPSPRPAGDRHDGHQGHHP